MTIPQDEAWDYAEKLLERPQRNIEVTLSRSETDTRLLHDGNAMAICANNEVGRTQAELVARALGIALPDVGGSETVGVSSGVLHRVMSISTMDPTDEDIWPLFARLLEEAEAMRANVSEPDL